MRKIILKKVIIAPAAGLTVAALSTLGVPAANANSVAHCGRSAHAAVYKKVHHNAVSAVTHVVKHPAVIHTETIWAKESPGTDWIPTGNSKAVTDVAAVPAVPATPEEGYTEHEWVKHVPAVVRTVTTPGQDAYSEIIHHDATPAVTEKKLVTPGRDAYSETVIDQPYVPGQPAVEAIPGKWWNFAPNNIQETFTTEPSFPNDPRGTWKGPHNTGGPDSEQVGTFAVGNAEKGGNWFHHEAGNPGREAVPEQKEVSHIVNHDAVPPVYEDVIVTPAVDAYDETIEHPAVPPSTHTEVVTEAHDEYVWAVDSPGDDWTTTGKDRFVVTKDAVSAVDAVPAVTHIEYEYVTTVVDSPEHSNIVTDVAAVPASTENVLVTPAVSATAPCKAPSKAVAHQVLPNTGGESIWLYALAGVLMIGGFGLIRKHS